MRLIVQLSEDGADLSGLIRITVRSQGCGVAHTQNWPEFTFTALGSFHHHVNRTISDVPISLCQEHAEMGGTRSLAMPLLTSFSERRRGLSGDLGIRGKACHTLAFFLPLPFKGKQANSSCLSSYLEFISEKHVLEHALSPSLCGQPKLLHRLSLRYCVIVTYMNPYGSWHTYSRL